MESYPGSRKRLAHHLKPHTKAFEAYGPTPDIAEMFLTVDNIAISSRAGEMDQPRLVPVPRKASDRKRNVRFRTRPEEHTSELQSPMRTSYAVFCLKQTHHT